MSTITLNSQFVRLHDSFQPITLRQIRRDSTALIPNTPTEEMMEYLGYALIHPTTAPEGDVVSPAPAVFSDGKWVQSWAVREYTTAELEDRLSRARKQHLNDLKLYETAVLSKGLAYEFPTGTYHVQLRDGDIGRITGLRVKADALISADLGMAPMVFRTYENVVLDLTAQQIHDMADAAFMGYNDMLQGIWDLKDQTLSAASVAEFPPIPAMPT